ncbi:hypothetical protein CC85DRAFT_55511 [Cutaneotrichosporon oleaginosum]|uniref:Uncharacterized protein n=1 Tax=Cutaneotrichosporon oleaginosum TaxID=879819 RepID=A0A0J0XYM4_9TREE|nr:uncharacterized protein CC85DRAFT_55511 [Cutaneotrichosporon oleaginosum]KLT46136.1 hypothetical protein CC85DRAFT_55511 [Cutaneotrichosporon oleaginosum]TXT10146.1 hypothetical protein COLE_04080 [Cutaneotrichosporon oleaginosum]
MAPLSLFRGQGGTTNTSAAAMVVDSVEPEPPRTPPPEALRRSCSGEGESVPSPSRLNPARLLRRKGSRSIREPRDRGEREEGWFGALRGQGHMSHSTSGSLDRSSVGRTSGSGAPSDTPQLRSSPSMRGLAHFASVATPASPSTAHSRHGSASSGAAVPGANANSNASNFGSVRSIRSIRSDGASANGDTEIILGPSPDHPLIKGEPTVIHTHPFLLSASGSPALTSYATPLSPPRRPPRSPVPPPPPPRGAALHHSDSRSSTPSSGSMYSDMGESGVSAAPTVRPGDARDLAETTVSRADTAAWLARKPSGRRPAPLASVVDGRRRAESHSSHISPSMSGTSASGESIDEPFTPTISPRIGGMPATPTSAQHQRHPMSAMISSSPRRPSPPPPPPPLIPAPTAPGTLDRSGYVVSVQCLPAAEGEVRWEVVMKRSHGPEADGLIASAAPGGPFSLTPSGDSPQSLHAPPFASSVNLSLALDTDAPSGKLQFITLPGVTPTHGRPCSVSQSAAPPSPRSYRRPESPNGLPFVPRDSVFGPSVLGPPAPLPPQPPRAQRTPPPPYGPRQEPVSPQSPTCRRHGAVWAVAPGPVSPRSPAYKRQGAVWAASGGTSPLSGGDVFTANPHMPSPRAAWAHAQSQAPSHAMAGRAPLCHDGSSLERANGAAHAARPSLDDMVERVQLA